MEIEVKKAILENSGYLSYTISDNDCLVGYDLLRRNKVKKLPEGTRIINEICQPDMEEKRIYRISSNFLERCSLSPCTIFKNDINIGYIEHMAREFFVHINNVDYEISRHKNYLSSIMKNDAQFALIKREKETLYHGIIDENVEDELPLILLLIMCVDRFYQGRMIGSSGDGIWFDYKENRTKWDPKDKTMTDIGFVLSNKLY